MTTPIIKLIGLFFLFSLSFKSNFNSKEINNKIEHNYKKIENQQPKFKKITSGWYHSCGITAEQDLYCWGDYIEITGRKELKGSRSELPGIVDPGEKYSDVSIGVGYSCGITSIGKIKCWGTDFRNKEKEIRFPKLIDETTDYIKVSVGYSHFCAITSSFNLKCWGDNSNGQLGRYDWFLSSANKPGIVDQNTKYSSISAGYGHTCGLVKSENETENGTLKCWGNNSYGQLGVGKNKKEERFPVIVNSPVKYSSISAGYFHTCGISFFGELSCWGANYDGQAGKEPSEPIYLPEKIRKGVIFSDLLSEKGHTCALSKFESGYDLSCFGWNDSNLIGKAIKGVFSNYR